MDSKNNTRNKLILAAAVTGLVMGTGAISQEAQAGGKEGSKKSDGHKCGAGGCSDKKKKSGDAKCADGSCNSKDKKKKGDAKCADGSCGDKKKK